MYDDTIHESVHVDGYNVPGGGSSIRVVIITEPWGLYEYPMR